MKILLTLILTLALTSIVQAKDTPDQKRIKAQHFPVLCKECKKGFIGQPVAAAQCGGTQTSQEWSLTFKCPKCKAKIAARHESPAEPVQVVAPLPVPTAAPPMPTTPTVVWGK